MPKHREIFEALREQIASGKYANAKRLPSEAELSLRYRVSRPTAARALRDLQQLGLIERRAGSGTFLKAPSPEAQPTTVGLFVPGLGNTEILDPICTEITRAAQSAGMSIAFPDAVGAPATPQSALATCRRFIERRVDGVFFAPLEHAPDREAVNRQIVDALHALGIAVVLLDRDVTEFPRRSELDLVGIDSFQAAFVLAEHLLRLGKRRFRFIARAGYPSTTDLRMAGCREAVSRAGTTLDADWARFGDPSDLSFVQRALDPMPDVIVCANDLTAALLMQSLGSIGVSVPHDVAVVGFDDVKYATLLSVPLTTIRQPCSALADVAVQTLQSRLANPALTARQVLLQGELIIRRSCGHLTDRPT